MDNTNTMQLFAGNHKVRVTDFNYNLLHDAVKLDDQMNGGALRKLLESLGERYEEVLLIYDTLPMSFGLQVSYKGSGKVLNGGLIAHKEIVTVDGKQFVRFDYQTHF